MAGRNVPVRLWASQDLDNDGVLTSGAINCQKADPNYLMFRVTHASGAPDVRIEFLVSDDGTNFNLVSTQDDIVTSTNTEWTATNPQDYHNLTCPGAPWIKIRVTEISAANLDNSVVDATLWLYEL